jgi:SAM-dependent methyltransferase
MIYETGNPSVFQNIPKEAKKVLDIGCGSGTFGQAIKNKLSCEVVGITYSEDEVKSASNYLDRVILMDLNNPNFSELDFKVFDCIICSHVLEHLYWPQYFLKGLRPLLSPNCKIIVALPNILNFRQRLKFLKGDFKYADWGVMDRTHFRFFDWDSSIELLEDSGFKVVERWADGYFPLPIIRSFVKPLAFELDLIATKKMPGLFGMQFVLIAYPDI